MDSQAEDGDQVEASEHEGELQSRGPLQLVGGKPLPLNSRRLTAPVLKQLAGALDLPSTAPLDDVRQMIEGKLLEMGREPRNTQVLLQEAARGVHVSLQDVDGIFLEAEPPVRAESPNGGSEQGEGLGEPGADDTEPLRQALHEAECEKHALQQEVRAMREELESVRARVNPVQGRESESPLLVEHSPEVEESIGIVIADALIEPREDGLALLVVCNPSGCSCSLDHGTCIGEAVPAEVVTRPETDLVSSLLKTEHSQPSPSVRKVDSTPWRQEKLRGIVGTPELLSAKQSEDLHHLLREHHNAFSLEEHERGEADCVEMEIHTGDATPRKVPARRMPFAVRQEVATQLRNMQKAGVIQPSSSPWASPVVIVRKKDGTYRFCVDYRALNAVTKADTFPLPRVDDLLDQLGDSRFFSTLDLASGYWQIRVDPGSIEKTAFVTPQGLFEFRVMPFGLTNAPAVFQRLMARVLSGLNPEDGPDFVSVYIDDILVFSQTLEQHLEHLRLVLQRILSAGLKLKPTKCHFLKKEVEYLGHILTPDGLRTNPKLVKSVEDFPQPKNVKEVRQFLGLSSYYRRFIYQFSSIALPLTMLTRKGTQFRWTTECQESFDTLKERLTTAPVLSYPSFNRPFVPETDASVRGLGAVLSQLQEDGQLHPVAYASRSLCASERNYSVTELETLAVVWSITHFHPYLYGHTVTVYTDHTAVKAILNSANPSAKHARWWTKVYGSGVGEVKIVYRSGKSNTNADALSRSPHAPAPEEGIGEFELQVATVTSESTEDVSIPTLLEADPKLSPARSFREEQKLDPELMEIIHFLETEELPADATRARKIAAQQSLFAVVDGVLYFIDQKQDNRQRAAVPHQLREQILEENHRSNMGGHFSGRRTYRMLARQWWWNGMYSEALRYVRNCPECAVVAGSGSHRRPPLHPIPVRRPFQIVGVDIMDLPKTSEGNKHVVVFQDYLTKWPMVYPLPDQKAHRIAHILVNEVIPFFGVPEALLSDRGTNLLSHLIKDLCALLGIKKLNTTAYHPECDGMVERFNRTLKSMLRKHAARFSTQWDRYLSGVLWAYRNTPHESTGEKPSFLMFGVDLRTPTEAALLPSTPLQPCQVEDYREEVILSLSSARELAAESISKAQQRYKSFYDRKATEKDYHIGDWVLVRFPQDETGKQRKLSRPWHGPYRIMSRDDPDVSVSKVYFPQEGAIQVHQSRVCPCPSEFPAGYFWYGSKRRGPGHPPKWTEALMQRGQLTGECFAEADDSTEEADAQAGSSDEPTESAGLEADTCTACDEMPPPRTSGRYSLRRQVQAPDRLCSIRSGRAPFEKGEVM